MIDAFVQAGEDDFEVRYSDLAVAITERAWPSWNPFGSPALRLVRRCVQMSMPDLAVRLAEAFSCRVRDSGDDDWLAELVNVYLEAGSLSQAVGIAPT